MEQQKRPLRRKPKAAKGVKALPVEGGGALATIVPAKTPPHVDAQVRHCVSPNGRRYREFVPQRLPVEYKRLTPVHRYGNLIWKDRVRCLKVVAEDKALRGLQVGSAVLALCVFGVVLFLVMVILIGD